MDEDASRRMLRHIFVERESLGVPAWHPQPAVI
jgi:hypothetical protein